MDEHRRGCPCLECMMGYLKQRPRQVQCRRCSKPDDPVYLDNDGKHICGDCWQQDRANEPQFDPMPWELGT